MLMKGKHPFTFNSSKDINQTEFLGSDGLPVDKAYNLYLIKCEEFKGRVRKYTKNNQQTKNSTLHNLKRGYESCEQLEEEVLIERDELLRHYQKKFDITSFNEDENAMYKCLIGDSKQIRVIRELNQDRNEDFLQDLDKKRVSWFTRYCILSRFVEASRKVILLNRLQKRLAILRTLTPEMIRTILDQNADEEEMAERENEEFKLFNIPCVCGAKESK